MQSLLAAIAHMPVPLEAGRIFHGRGGLYPDASHWTLDAYPPVFVLTSFAPVEEGDVAILDAALRQPLSFFFPVRTDGAAAPAPPDAAAHEARESG